VDLRQLASALALLNSLDPSALPTHHAQALVFLALEGPCTYRQLEDALGTSNASVSRILTALSTESNRRSKPLGLVEIYRDPGEGRRYLCRLNSKGQAIARALASL